MSFPLLPYAKVFNLLAILTLCMLALFSVTVYPLYIPLCLSLPSLSYCFVFFNIIYCLASYYSYFSPVCVCVDCDGRETASTFLFMFRSMFSTSRIVFAVFSYRLCVSIFFNPKTQKKKKKMKKKNNK